MKGKVLVVDDSAACAQALSGTLADLGYEAHVVADGAAAVAASGADTFDVVVTDVQMSGMDGMELMRVLHARDPELPVIVVSGFGTIALAVEATRAGAFTFLTKPLDARGVEVQVRNAVAARRLQANLRALDDDDAIVGRSPALHAALGRADLAAASDAPVLITGETGTGKELCARRIHARSPRARGPFVAINAGAIPETLMEAELFGHAKGAFTGATADRKGVFEAANGGTLFLDEVGEVAPAAQVRLLRVLQEGVVRRVGEVHDRAVDARIIAATHRNLSAPEAFRPDLYFRLAVLPIELPALRERGEDALLLFGHALEHACRRGARPVPSIAPDAIAALVRHRWPGNVREVRNLAERVAVFCRGDHVSAGDLGLDPAQGDGDVGLPVGDFDLCAWLEGLEAAALRRALERTGGVKARAAASLGLERNAFRYKLAKYGILD